jgi:hypothetical protein
VADLRNNLGLFGAFTAHFFINLTLGYFSVVFPLLLIVWCGVALARLETARPVLVTNYALLFAFLLSACSGVLRYSVGGIGNEWSGLLGAFTGDILVSLIGAVGALIFLVACLGVTVVFAVDLDVQKSVERFKRFYAQGLEMIRRRRRIMVRNPEMREEGSVRTPITPAVSLRDPQGEDETLSDTERYPDREASLTEESTISGDTDEGIPVTGPDDPGEGMVDPGGLKIEIQERAGEREEDPAVREDVPLRDASGVEEEIDYVSPSVDLLDHPRQAETVDSSR